LEENEPDVITNACIDPSWTCDFRVFNNAEIDTEEFDGLTNGNHLVFQMITETQGSPNIADDEFTNILIFELEDDHSSFSVDDDQLKDLNTHFRRICFCKEPGFQEIKSGCLQGECLLDDSWLVQGHLIVSYDFGDVEVKIEAQFF